MRHNQNTIITGKKVVLIPYKEKHVEKYHAWMQSDEIRKQTASELLSLEDEYRMQNSWAEDDDKCTFIILDASVYNGTDESEISSMVGDVNLFLNDADDKHTAEIEIMIAEIASRSKGLGREAVLHMMKYGYLQLGIARFVAKIGDDNSTSLHLFKKLHYQQVSHSAVFNEVTLELRLTPALCDQIFSV